MVGQHAAGAARAQSAEQESVRARIVFGEPINATGDRKALGRVLHDRAAQLHDQLLSRVVQRAPPAVVSGESQPLAASAGPESYLYLGRAKGGRDQGRQARPNGLRIAGKARTLRDPHSVCRARNSIQNRSRKTDISAISRAIFKSVSLFNKLGISSGWRSQPGSLITRQARDTGHPSRRPAAGFVLIGSPPAFARIVLSLKTANVHRERTSRQPHLLRTI